MGERGIKAEAWVALAALGIYAVAIGTPAMWIDERFTAAWASSPLGALGALFLDADLVHAAYYLLVWPWAQVSSGAVWMRLPSVMAMAAAAVVVFRLGERLGGRRVAWCSAGVFVALPVTSRYAQEARPYALVVLLSALSALMLLRALERDRWAGYGATVAALGLVNVFAVLVLPAHLVAAWGRRRWVLAVSFALLPWAMLAAVASVQVDQVAFIANHQLADVLAFTPARLTGLPWGLWLLPLTLAAAGARRVPRWVTVWAVAPVVLLLAAALVEPVYWPRYLLTIVPALALLAGATVARRPWLAVLLVPVCAVGQVWVRMPDAHTLLN